jgi:hypothetical protein
VRAHRHSVRKESTPPALGLDGFTEHREKTPIRKFSLLF